MDWYLGPGSRFQSVNRLLPSQVLVLPTGELRPRRLLPAVPSDDTYDDLLDKLQTCLVNAVRQAAKQSNNLFLPLTAGHDSRLLLAIARYANINVTTYTNSHQDISQADLIIPPKLAKAAGFKHIVHKGGAFRSDLAAVFDRHTGGQCVDRDRFYITHQYFTWARQGAMILRGGCFEIGRCYYWGKFPETAGGPSLPGSSVIADGFNEQSDPTLLQTLDQWIAWANSTSSDEMDWRDRLYLEQRLAGWLSSVEQALDLVDAERFLAANSHFFLAHVLQIPPEKRCSSQHQVDLIKRMAPELLEFPFNPQVRKPLPRRVLKKVKRLLQTVR